MESIRRAVIDIGTNSVKLLVADVNGRDVRPIWEDSKQTRLGSGFYETHRLQAEQIAQTARAVANFAATAREFKTNSIRCIATSAARDAVNPNDLVSAIQETSGLKVEIISGDLEADWVFQGVATDAKLARRHLLLLDVGGGSTELILGQGQHKHFLQSYPIGTVRLLEQFPPSDPPKQNELAACRTWLKTFLEAEVRPRLQPILKREIEIGSDQGPMQLVGTGGTASILARMEAELEDFDRERIEDTGLTLQGVRRHAERVWELSLEERREKIIGLPRKRADVILTGVLIYEAIMEQFDFSELRVSTRGLRFAAVMDGAGV